MTKRIWSGRVIFRYILFQLPGWVVFILLLLVISRFVSIPMWVMIILLFLWILKDAAMYPLVWRSYDERNADPLVGMKGTVTEDLNPTGHIMIRGELWKAETQNGNLPVNKGETVLVSGSRGLTLFVQPERESNNG